MFGLGFIELLNYIDTSSPELIMQAELLRKSTALETIQSTFEYVKQNITYVSDIKDHWQKPLATLQRGVGDCEDISNFFASLLTINGITNWLMVVKNHQWQQYHVINAVETKENGMLLLDTSIGQAFGSKPYYYNDVFVHGFYNVFGNKFSPPLVVPFSLNLFILIYSFLNNPLKNFLKFD